MANPPKTTSTRQFAGLVLARVKPAKLDTLRDLLKQVGDQTIALMRGEPAPDPIIPFDKLETIHYARFVLLEHDPKQGPMLAFSTNYDGPEGEDTCSEGRALDHHV